MLIETATSVVFCDLDGTLVDTAQANYGAYRAALSEFKVPFSWSSFETTWGRDSRDFIPDIAPQLSAADILMVRRRKAELYPDFVHLTVVNIPLRQLLLAMKPVVTVVLVTTAKRQNVRAVLAHHGLETLFEHVVCGEDTVRSKPWPDPYLYALSLLGESAERSITFEDSASGIESARLACIGSIKVGF